MSPEERDQELFERYLEGDSDVSRVYRRNADEQPNAALDARILAEAHRAVARDRRVAHSPFARNWAVPTSLAAVLVLSVSVVLLMPDPALETGVEQGSAAEPAPVPAAAEPKRENAAGRLEGDADAKEDAAGDALRLEPPRAAEPADRPAAKPSEKRKASSAEQQGISSGALKSQPAAPAARVADEAETRAAPQAPRTRDSTGKALQEATTSSSTPEPLPAASLRTDPAAWLAFIERLVDEHNLDAAKSNLRAFRRQYPDYPLSRALEPLAASLDAQGQ